MVVTDSDQATGHRTLRKVIRHLMPLLIACYVVNFVDRVNLGVAALEMNADLGLTATMYGLASGLFFIGYLLFQVPANWMMHRLGARTWLGILLVAWGACSSATCLATGPHSLYVLRFILGVAEAGFYPGVLVLLGHWFPRHHRARATALFLLAIPLANVVGLPISSLLVDHGAIGRWAGWQVMFLVEGAPAVLLGLLVWRLLPNGPQQARWLTPPERAWLSTRLAAEAQQCRMARHSFAATLREPRLLVFAVINAGLYFALYSIQFFLPQVISDLHPTATIATVGWTAAGCYAVAALAMLAWSRHADRAGERVRHLVIPMLAAAAVLVLGVPTGSPVFTMAAILVALAGVFAAIPVFWALPATLLTGMSAAAGIAAINSISSLASFLGPYATGALKDATGGYAIGLLVVAAFLALTALVALPTRRMIPQLAPSSIPPG